MPQTRKALGFLTSTAVVLAMLTAMTTVTAQPASAAPLVADGAAASTAAASCWEIKQDKPDAVDGSYWLLTPAMDAPAQFYCDMTTDGGGWVLIGKGREGWTEKNEGKGSVNALRAAGLSPMSGTTSQYPALTVNKLINNGRVDALPDGIRLKRAKDAAGTTWQEARFNTNKLNRWVWTFGAEFPVAFYSFDGVAGSGGLTSNYGRDSSYQRVTMSMPKSQGYTLGYAYGSGVVGTNASDTYLWSATNGLGGARPYTEMYLRPQIRSTDAGFIRIADAGTAAYTTAPVAQSLALNSPWGVMGLANPLAREGDVEVQAFAQIGTTMYVGGNFRYVQKAANSTGADKVDQPFLAAFNVADGELIRTFTPKLNASVEALAALPNGKLAVAGRFNQANNQPATAIVALDPATGATVPGFVVNIENRLTSGVLDIRAMTVKDNWLYLGGAFTHLTGATGGSVYARAAARIDAATGMPGTNWNPEFNGSVAAIGASADGGRLYAAGYFTASGIEPASKAAAVQTSANAPLATPAWSPVWSAKANYQQAIGEVGNRVWVGGSEHSFFSYDRTSFDRLSGNIGKANGDYQAMTSGSSGMVYGGCHCFNWNYSNAFTWPSVGTGWTEANSIGWVAAYDSATGNVVPSFTPIMNMRAGSGVWALSIDSAGTLWAGGDIETAATPTSAGRWAGGFARFAQTDAQAPTTPGGVVLSQDGPTTAKLTWSAATDNSASVSYQILRDNKVIATTTSTTATVPKHGENRFFVRSVDGAGNLSASSPVITASGANTAPVAVIATTVNQLKLSADGTGSSDPDGTIASYAWDFGDGGSATTALATHQYAAAGTYTVKLLVTDNKGASNQATAQVTVTAPAGTVDVVTVEPKSSWNWRFESGAPAASWKDPGFNASAWASGNGVLGFGTTGLGTNIDISGPTSARPRAAYFVKTFTLDSAAAVTKLSISTVADDGVVVYVNGTEVARSNMPAGTITSDSYASSSIRTSAAVANPVIIDVPLRLLVDGVNTIAAETHLNYRGTSDISFDLNATATITQGEPAPNKPPVAAFTNTVSGLAVSVDAAGSSDPDGTIASYAWDFGDQSTATGATAEHSYAAAGTYTVTLTVRDNRDGTAVSAVPVTVAAPTGPANVVVVPAKSAWSWRFQVDAPPAAWKDAGFDASAWASGNGVLGFGTTGLGTNIDISGPASDRPRAAYFVKTFTLDSAAAVAKLSLSTVADDGVVVYVNGTEVGRSNMPTGPVTSSTYATSSVKTSAAVANPVLIDVPLALLVNGKNVISAETHLNYRATTDITFDLNATASIRP